MAEQWSDRDPGAGSPASMGTLAGELQPIRSTLHHSQEDLARVDDVFDGDWTGNAARAARARLTALQSRAEAVETSVLRAQRAVATYAAQHTAIKAATAVQVQLLRDALAQFVMRGIGGPLVPDPSVFADLEAARQGLLKLAARRRAADEDVLGELRAAVATTWDVDPEDYPDARNEWIETDDYQYSIDDPLGVSTDDYTAEELMDLFREHPSDIFPFEVSGDSTTFEDGAVFTLSDTLLVDGAAQPYEAGDVVVTVTGTSVKFTVISDQYFEGPGSTIEFSIVEVNGEWVLRKTADAVNGVKGAGAAGPIAAALMWDQQAENFRQIIEDAR